MGEDKEELQDRLTSLNADIAAVDKVTSQAARGVLDSLKAQREEVQANIRSAKSYEKQVSALASKAERAKKALEKHKSGIQEAVDKMAELQKTLDDQRGNELELEQNVEEMHRQLAKLSSSAPVPPSSPLDPIPGAGLSIEQLGPFLASLGASGEIVADLTANAIKNRAPKKEEEERLAKEAKDTKGKEAAG